jgi:hypothetical protein
MKRLLTVFIVLLALTACNRPTPAPLPTPTATFEPLILLPTHAPTEPLPTPTVSKIESTPTQAVYTPIDADVIFDNYLLRNGPGRMFDVVRMYDTGTKVALLAREPGNNWVLVQTEDNYSGWMNVVGLNLIGDVTPLPIIKVTNAQVLHGHVWALSKAPANNVGVSITRVYNPSPEYEDVSTTNSDGEWYLYLPINLEGDWVVGVNSYGCNSSVVDNPTSCALIGMFPGAQAITLPQKADVNIEFAFQAQ